jgi:energy-coupling factor transporter ATP-binding protein EcfA2
MVTDKPTFPQIVSVKIDNFSIYTLRPSISIDFKEGVFCLAGANGMGKSTFLAAVNFGLTGRVPDPSRKFESTEDYFNFTNDFSKNYFDGRVEDRDRKDAEVEITMRVGSHTYILTRGMFEPESLRALVIKSDNRTIYDGNKKSVSGDHRNDKYKEHLARDIGVHTFDQYVFLQLFVFTFDERRRLLFWDQPLLQTALYLTFNLDYVKAKEADTLRKDIEHHDSNVRNIQWDIHKFKTRAKELEAALGQRHVKDEQALKEEYDRLNSIRDSALEKLADVENDNRDLVLQLSEASSRYTARQHDYKTFFHSQSHSADLETHPLISSTIRDKHCGLCGTDGPHVLVAVQKWLKSAVCPICSANVHAQQNEGNYFAQLKKLDAELAKLKLSVEAIILKVARKATELAERQSFLKTASDKLATFEDRNREWTAHQVKGHGKISDALAGYKAEISKLEQKKAKHLRGRESAKKDLRQLTNELAQNYTQVQDVFVPEFQGLAKTFLGLDVDIQLDTPKKGGINLVLEIKGTARRFQHELSESQKFFVDIALRMALAQWLSTKSHPATLFIDTPEGSLDIAYEARAGDMFSVFANSHNLLMTANINSSQLLINLAEKCGHKKMVLHRMTDWAEMSKVQQDEDGRFTGAFANISAALDKKPLKATHK